MTRLKVLLTLNRFYPEVGGAETNLYYQACALAERHEVTVFTPSRTADPMHERMKGFTVRRFFDWLNPLNRRPNLKVKTLCPGMFWRVLFGKRFDVIMCFPAVSYNNRLVMLAAKLRAIPTILCFFDLLDYSKIIGTNGSISANILDNYKVPKKEAFFIRMASHVYAISNRELNLLKPINASASYSPVPIKLDEYESQLTDVRSRYGIQDSDFVFLSLGRISAIKGQEIALQSFLPIAKEYPSAKLVFVGRHDFEPEIAARMSAIIKKAGLETQVIFTGVVEREEVLSWLRFSDIHVIPVRFMNSGAVVVESWASNTPVIQSDAVDPNLVKEGLNGYLFPSENVEGLTAKMNQAIEERELLPAMGRAGNALVKERYTYEYLISMYEDLFNELQPVKERATKMT